MAAQSRRLPLQQQIAEAGLKKAAELLATRGISLPCIITKVNGSLVTIKFTVKGILLPGSLQIPVAQSLYARAPYQVNDRGVAIALNAPPTEASGQVTDQPQVNVNGNLGCLFFLPIGNKNWSDSPDPDMYLLQGPNGFVIRSIDGSVSVTGTKGKSLVVACGDKNFTLDSSGAKLNCDLSVDGAITATGDITAAGISLKSHTHQVTGAPGTTGTPQG